MIAEESATAPAVERTTLAGGCFWCTEAVFQRVRGVQRVTSGYAGGETPQPSYDQVSTGKTGHTEAAQIIFNPNIISYDEILDIFFATHDPTEVNRQGPDVGPQYRSVIFTHSPAQQRRATDKKTALNASGKYQAPVATEILPFTNFFPAENAHQNFYNRNAEYGYCVAIIDPKIKKLLKEFPERVQGAARAATE